MHIVHLCTEIAPVAKVGGLADVVYGLSRELIRQGHTVEVIIPKYDTIDYRGLSNLHVHYRELWSFDGPARYNNTIWSAELEQIKILLIEPHHPSYFFSRGAIYGVSDDIDRFLYFTRAAMEFLFKSKRNIDCLHLHDWPTAVASTLYRDMYAPLGMPSLKCLLTLHNIEHQGRCSAHNLSKIGLQGEMYLREESYQDPSIPQVINLLKGGIAHADALTTVSPTYREEILSWQHGHGLETILTEHKAKLHGILNGIDPLFWDPEKDPHLIQRYPPLQTIRKKNISLLALAKEENKKHLCTHLDLDVRNGPVVGCVTRLAEQKGPQLIAHAVRRTIENNGIFILLGSQYSNETRKMFEDLKKEHAGRRQFGLLLDRDESLAHLIFAGSDYIAVPSLFEPCGLTQLIALRYGAIPIVRRTGGLADTVFDYREPHEEEKKNGIVFLDPNKKGVEQAIDCAHHLWNTDRENFQRLQINALRCDFSWKISGQRYIDLYQSL